MRAKQSNGFVHVKSFSNLISFVVFSIYDLIFSPNGSYILVAAGNLILVIIHLQMNLISFIKQGSLHDFHGLFTKETKVIWFV